MKIRVAPEDEKRARDVLRAAGFIVRGARPEDEQTTIEAERYAGVPSPDGALQRAHLDEAEKVLKAEGVTYTLAGTGVTIAGGDNPFNGVAALAAIEPTEARRQIRRAGSATPQFLGTCVAMRHSNAFLAAAHCVESVDARTLFVDCPSASELYAVESIENHPTADLVILRLGGNVWAQGISPFSEIHPEPAWGEDFAAFGFPEDVFGDAPAQPTARVFRGYIQRLFQYQGPASYGYLAAELNIACPAGLSGGPLFLPTHPSSLLGIVTENRESATAVGRVEETISEVERVTRIERNVIQYGVALVLHPLSAWIDEQIPAASGRYP
jgi:hypothetical protein